MNLFKRAKHDLIDARKARTDTVAIGLLQSVISEATVEARKKENRDPTDDEMMLTVRRFLKNNAETQTTVSRVARPNHVEELAQLTRQQVILEQYLPTQLTPDEIGVAIDTFLANGGARVVGKVMAHLREAYPNAIDGRIASEVVKTKLA